MNFGINFPIVGSRSIITLDNFINNPTGKGSSMMGKRENIKKDLAVRYSNILQKTSGVLNYQIFTDKNDEHYYFYFKIPSETFNDLFYDVVLDFQCDDKKYLKFTTIADYSINFFSNSPHMTMTYTYVLNQNRIIVPFLKSKYSSDALNNAPKVRNPVEMFGFEKTCYYAALYIRDNRMYEKAFLRQHAVKFDSVSKNKILNSVMSQDHKFIQYQELKRKQSNEKKKQKYEEVKAKNINEYNRVIKEINRKREDPKKTVNKKSKMESLKMNKFKSTTARHKPFKSVIKK